MLLSVVSSNKRKFSYYLKSTHKFQQQKKERKQNEQKNTNFISQNKKNKYSLVSLDEYLFI